VRVWQDPNKQRAHCPVLSSQSPSRWPALLQTRSLQAFSVVSDGRMLLYISLDLLSFLLLSFLCLCIYVVSVNKYGNCGSIWKEHLRWLFRVLIISTGINVVGELVWTFFQSWSVGSIHWGRVRHSTGWEKAGFYVSATWVEFIGGWGKLCPHEPRLKYECLMKITKAMQLTHNVHNSGTIIPILCYEILSMRLLSCGTEVANLWQWRSRVYETAGCPSVRPSVCPSSGPQQQTLTLAGEIDRLLHGAQKRGGIEPLPRCRRT